MENEINFEKFAERLRELRKASGMNASAAAKHLGVSAAHYSKLETGETLPSVELLIGISELYNVSLDYLLGLSNRRYNAAFLENFLQDKPDSFVQVFEKLTTLLVELYNAHADDFR